MIRVKCGNTSCSAMLRLNTDNIQSSVISVTCPKCTTKNKVSIPKKMPQKKITPKPQISSDATMILDDSSFDSNLNTDAMGWLVVHTENMEAKTFPLKIGKNLIGRLTDETENVLDVKLSGDSYISRYHCVMEVVENRGKIKYVLYEFKKKPSMNGTFLNNENHRLKPTDEFYIKDGETIQIGRTKVVLKTKKIARNASAARNQVGKTAIAQTIIV